MKKGIAKSFLSVLLVLVMVVSVLPMSAMAAEFKSFNVEGVDVNVAFGGEVNPNNVLSAEYNIKAVGAILMNLVGSGKDAKMEASAEVELYVPYSLFTDTINEKLADGIASVVNPALNLYNGKVTEYLGKTITYTDTVEDYEVIPGVYVDIPVEIINATLADLIEIIRSGYVEFEYLGNVYTFYYADLYDGAENALKTMVDSAVSEFGLTKLTYSNSTSEGRAYKNWVAAAADPNSDADALAESLVSVLGLKYAQEKYENAVVKPLIGSVKIYVGSKPSETFKSKAQISEDLKNAIETKIDSLIGDYVDGLLSDIEVNFYGPLYPELDETLTTRFDGLKEIIDLFIEDVSLALDGYDVDGLSSVSIPMPTDQISGMEDMLKSIVAEINESNDADSVVINGTIMGTDEVNDELTSRNTTGMYVVAGVNSDDTDDMKYAAYVIAPEVVPVSIKANGSDMGYFMHCTVGETCAITSSASNGDDESLMGLRIAGVETDGGTYDVTGTGTDGVVPTNAGVYTVFSFYLNKSTLAMGGDVAVLVVEPQDTPDGEFKFTESEASVDYDGNGHFPELTNTNNHMSVSIAADKNNADVYVILPDNFGDTVGVYTDHAEDILARLEAKAENAALPLPEQITAKILGALTALDTYANKAEGPGVVTNVQIKTRLNNYLTAIKDWYSTETIVDKAGNVVDKVKEVLSTNPTILKYRDMIDSILEKFQSFNTQPAVMAIDAENLTTEQKVVKEFLSRFMDEVSANKDDVRALLSYIVDYVDNSSYKQDAVTLIKTLGIIGKVETAKVDTAMANVETAFNTLKANVKAKLVEIDNRADKVPTKADAKVVLGYVEDFIQSIETEAKNVVNAFTVQNVYFGIMPSEVGVYDCYAVNVSANYVPNLATATLEIVNNVHVHTPGQPVRENEVPADCGNDGSYDEVVYCTDPTCGEELSRVTVPVPATGNHTPGTAVKENEVACDCGNDGSYDSVVYCSVCNEELSRNTVPVPATGNHTPGTAVQENYQAETLTTPESYDSVVYCSVCNAELSRDHVVVLGDFICLNVQTGVYYKDLSIALSDVDDPAEETVLMLADCTEDYVLIAPGTTLDLDTFTVTANFVVGMKGSYLTAEPDSGKLVVADKKNLTLSEEGYQAGGAYILPIWDPAQNCYVFSKFIVKTTDNGEKRGLFIDEANEHIMFQFKHQATGAINHALLADGSSDNALKVVVRLVWNTGKGEAYQDFVYNDTFVGYVVEGKLGVPQDYIFDLIGYSAMNVDLNTLKVVGMIITDSGAVAYGQVWDYTMDKQN